MDELAEILVEDRVRLAKDSVEFLNPEHNTRSKRPKKKMKRGILFLPCIFPTLRGS